MDKRYYEPYQNLVNRMPWFLALGNHDVELVEGNLNRSNYFASYVLPLNTAENNERFYSFDYGNIHFVSIDTTWMDQAVGDLCNDVPPPFNDPGQLDWLCQDLASARRFWKIVFFHHPAYTSVLVMPEAIKAKLRPIFDKYHVDIAIQAHAHVYERTVPVFDDSSMNARRLRCPSVSPSLQAYSNPRSPTFGTIWLTTGGGGAGLSAIAGFTPSTHTDLVFDCSCLSSAFHITQFTVTSGASATPEKIAIEAKNKDGLTLDLAELTKTLPPFWRGDANGDRTLDISDAQFIFGWLFTGGPPPDCVDAADANDDGAVDISDGTRILNFLFLGGPPPMPPFGSREVPECGQDGSPDNLKCEFYGASFPGCEPLATTACPVSCP